MADIISELEPGPWIPLISIVDDVILLVPSSASLIIAVTSLVVLDDVIEEGTEKASRIIPAASAYVVPVHT